MPSLWWERQACQLHPDLICEPPRYAPPSASPLLRIGTEFNLHRMEVAKSSLAWVSEDQKPYKYETPFLEPRVNFFFFQKRSKDTFHCFWKLRFGYTYYSYLSCCWTAAAKSLQSCPTLCDPIDSSPPGSPAPGILQARTLEWVAISFSNAWKWKVKVKTLSRVQLLETPWTAAHQAPLSMGFSRQEYRSGLAI